MICFTPHVTRDPLECGLNCTSKIWREEIGVSTGERDDEGRGGGKGEWGGERGEEGREGEGRESGGRERRKESFRQHHYHQLAVSVIFTHNHSTMDCYGDKTDHHYAFVLLTNQLLTVSL